MRTCTRACLSRQSQVDRLNISHVCVEYLVIQVKLDLYFQRENSSHRNDPDVIEPLGQLLLGY